MVFEGEGCWDERMEHVSKHMRAGANNSQTRLDQEQDPLLIE